MRTGTFETAMTAGQRALWAAAAALPLAFAAPGPAAAQDSEEVLYSIPDELFKTPIQESEARVLDWLRSNPDLPDSVLDGDNNTFMHYAATNLSSILREAVRRGGDCNRKNAHGATPLHFAAVQDGLGPGPEALRILVRCEAAPNVEPMCAAGERTAEDCRADPNARDRLGATPLHSLYEGVEAGTPFPIRNFNSILSGARFDVAKVLLEELGTDPNVKDNDGDTPLMLMVRAVNSGAFSQDKASLLLRHGADPNTRNNKGATPLIEIVSLFSEVNEDEDSIRLIRLLLRRGADPDLRARNSDTPLIRAAKHEDDSLYEIRALLAGGADPCLRDRRGRIAHQYAEDVGAEASMEALERAGGYLSFVNSVHGFCVADLRMAEEREKKLALDQGARRKFQSCLRTLGFDPGEPDGLFGPRTRGAVRAWQASEGREGGEAAGFFSRDDADALLTACAAAAPAASLLLLIDVSGSMGGSKLNSAKTAATDTIRNAIKSKTEIAVLAFTGDCGRPIQDSIGFSRNERELTDFVNGLKAGGGTPLATALEAANEFMRQYNSAASETQMIFLLADGDDSCGGLDSILSKLKKNNLLYRHETVGLEVEASTRRQLENIASRSGGNYHSATSENLAKVFSNTFLLVDCRGGNWNTYEFFKVASAAAVERCLASGVDPNARDKDGWTPLYWAVDKGDKEVINALLDAGAKAGCR